MLMTEIEKLLQKSRGDRGLSFLFSKMIRLILEGDMRTKKLSLMEIYRVRIALMVSWRILWVHYSSLFCTWIIIMLRLSANSMDFRGWGMIETCRWWLSWIGCYWVESPGGHRCLENVGKEAGDTHTARTVRRSTFWCKNHQNVPAPEKLTDI